MASPYIVWSVNRTQKTVILVSDDDEPSPYDSLILKASLKMGLNGSSLVLESNGTPVEEEVLLYLKNEVFILLQPGEEWSSPKQEAKFAERSQASASTVTLNTFSDHSFDLVEVPREVSMHDVAIIDENTPVLLCSQSISVDCNTENMWKNFKIPWEKLSSNQIQNFQNNIKDSGSITRLTQLTVEDMRSIKTNIPTTAFKIVAKKIIDAYPSIFIDTDRDGIVLGDGSHRLVQKLVDRNNYLNRPFQKRAIVDNIGPNNPVKNKKRFVSARAGCLNWSPEITETVNDQQKNITENDVAFYDVLDKTYPEIRMYLNKSEYQTISNIKEEWPILLSFKSLKWHFNKLTNSNIDLLDRLPEDAENIHALWAKKFKEVESTSVTSDAIDCLTKISQYFNEDINELVIVNKEENSSVNVDLLPVTPCIFTDNNNRGVFYVYVEKECVDLQGYSTFMDALKVAFSLYFILNLKYPLKMQATFELLQRMYLKIHPDTGSKNKTKVTSTKKKVLNFMLKFKKH